MSVNFKKCVTFIYHKLFVLGEKIISLVDGNVTMKLQVENNANKPQISRPVQIPQLC